jgi:hypothetical protein
MRIPIVCLVFALLAGCATHRPPYDPQVTVAVRELFFRTKKVVEDGGLTLADSRQFLKQSRAKARAVRQRVIQTRTTAQELAVLDSLDQEYQSLLRRRSPLRGPAATELMADLDRLQVLRDLPDRWVPQVGTYVPDNDIPSGTTDTRKCRDDHDHHHDHDHDDRDCGCKNDHH